MAVRFIGGGNRTTGENHLPVVISLGVAIACGCMSATVNIFYDSVTQTDGRWNKASELPPFERVVPTDKQKFVVVSQEYKAIDELEKLKAEIGPYKVKG